ncbi:MAG: glutamyl-tRNA reductase [Planctomycetota bacterium]
MNLQLVGCSHHESGIRLREQLAFREDQVPGFLNLFYETYPESEAVLLSTCNRTEFYVTGRNPDALPSTDEMIELLARHRGINGSTVRDSMFHHRDRQAVFHLFKVAASLDSMVLGEAQILSQVKQAYQLAAETNDAIPFTHHVFQAAIRAARRVSRETKIHSSRVSIPSVAICSLAKRIFERLDNKRILVVGAGKMAGETLTYLNEEGARDINLVNRTFATAQELGERYGGKAHPWEELESQLGMSDLVVSTTAAREPVVTGGMFDRIEASRQQRPLLILDLAIPRDFDLEIGDRLNVYLYSIDDLKAECERNRRARKSEWPKAERILMQETDDFLQQMKRREGGPAIAQLRRQVNEVKELELRRLLNRLEIDEEQRKEIEYSFNRVVNKILHPPMASLNNQNVDEEEQQHSLLDALKRLFQLGD